jgi:hypothetical protein
MAKYASRKRNDFGSPVRYAKVIIYRVILARAGEISALFVSSAKCKNCAVVFLILNPSQAENRYSDEAASGFLLNSLIY